MEEKGDFGPETAICNISLPFLKKKSSSLVVKGKAMISTEGRLDPSKIETQKSFVAVFKFASLQFESSCLALFRFLTSFWFSLYFEGASGF